MLTRSLSLLALDLAVAVLASRPLLAADDKAHEAKVVKVGDGTITLTFKGDDKKHTHDVAKDAKISLDGKPAKLGDLKEGFHVKVTLDTKFVVTRIDAHSKNK